MNRQFANQRASRVLRCCRQQTLLTSFCEASAECQERIFRRSSQRFSTTRNHPLWRRVSSPQTEQEEQSSQSQKCSRRRSFRRLPSKAGLRSEGKVSARNSLPSRSERKGTVQAGFAHLWSIG